MTRIAVIGAGAIGSAIAAGLAAANRDVILVARGHRLEWLQKNPLHICSNAETKFQTVTTQANQNFSELIDLAIVCVKAPDFAPAVQGLASRLAPDAAIMTLQNGVEAHEIAARLLPDIAIIAGRVHGFFQLEDNIVRHVGVQPSILLGCTHGSDPGIEAQSRDVFVGSGFSAEVSANIHGALWEKFLLAASLGGVACALDIPAGQVGRDQQGGPLLRAAMAEIVALAQASGVALTLTDIETTLAFVGSFPGDATTSLQRDLKTGRPSEYDAVIAAVPRLAKQQKMPTPVFTTLAAMIAVKTAKISPSRY